MPKRVVLSISPFQAALSRELVRKGPGAQTWLAGKIGKSQQLISALASGKNQGSCETRTAIARAFGWEYVDFLILGRSLLMHPESSAAGKTGAESDQRFEMLSDAVVLGRIHDLLQDMSRRNRDLFHTIAALVELQHRHLVEMTGADGPKARSTANDSTTGSRPNEAAHQY